MVKYARFIFEMEVEEGEPEESITQRMADKLRDYLAENGISMDDIEVDDMSCLGGGGKDLREICKNIQRLYEGYFNTDQDTDLFAREFFYAVGEILGGKPLEQLDLRYILKEDL
jgi:hypothetical protein